MTFTILSTCISRNCEYLACGSELVTTIYLIHLKSKIYVVDLVNRDISKFDQYVANQMNEPLISITFTYFNDRIIAGSALGTLIIHKIYQLPS